MIVFDLACSPAAHVFEAWFGSSDDYEAQRKRGLVACPMCGSTAVEKAVMAPRLSAKANSRALTKMPAPSDENAPPPPEVVKALLSTMAEAQRRVLEKSDYVGDRFAAEARAIHLGEAGERAIHGVATITEARDLIEDGIRIAPLPFPVRPPRTDH
jgi:hypothetical protein